MKCDVCGKYAKVEAYGKNFCSWDCAVRWLDE